MGSKSSEGKDWRDPSGILLKKKQHKKSNSNENLIILLFIVHKDIRNVNGLESKKSEF